jgi:hypothetical protein
VGLVNRIQGCDAIIHINIEVIGKLRSSVKESAEDRRED